MVVKRHALVALSLLAGASCSDVGGAIIPLPVGSGGTAPAGTGGATGGAGTASTAGGSAGGGGEAGTGGEGGAGGSSGTAGGSGKMGTGGDDGGAADGGGGAADSGGGADAPFDDAFANDASRPCDAGTGGMDWARALVDSTNKRFPNPAAAPFDAWSYQPALFLHGEYLVYKRTRDARYLQYVKAWVDSQIDASGNIPDTLSWLDDIMPGNVLVDVYQEAPEPRYKTAIERIRKRFDSFPRTSDGAFWHNTGATGQTWGDGVFMSCPFLARYGQLFGDAAYANDETSRQLMLYHEHLKHPTNGTHYHAWDEQGDATWTTAAVKHSSESWCRAVGWYGMAMIEVLEVLPSNHVARPELVSILQGLVEGFKRNQDPVTGRWFQVIDKGADSGNWLETSCSAMLAYTVSRAVQRGYVAATYAEVVSKAYAGVMQKVTLGGDGLTNITDISVGTGVGNLAYYYGRGRATNDFHGLGAVLIMLEQFRRSCP